MHSATFKNLARLQKSLIATASREDIFEVSILADVWASKDFSVSISKCGNRILKVAKDLSKFATIYYGKGGAGLLLVCKEDGTVLLLKRSKSVEQPFTWGIPGGALSKGEGWHKKEDIEGNGDFSDEDFSEAAFREAAEELFSDSSAALDKSKMTLVGQTEFKDGGFTYRTLVYDIPLEEKKRISANLSLNWENDRAKWYRLSDLPSSLHFGVKFTKENLEDQGIKLFEAKNDELDWIREYLESLLTKVKNESSELIKELVQKVSVMIPSASSKEEGEDHSDFRFRRANAVHKFFNYATKELSKIGERKVAIEVMNYGSRFAQQPKDKYGLTDEKSLTKLPSAEQSAHSGFFYHGSELRNAISILNSGIFVGAGAFTRLSLTSDISVASKFGDTIFVFDAKKLQRSGAKKMNYGDIALTEKIREQSGGKVDENYIKNPWISDLYRYEKEWILPLPYEIRPGDLVKIIYFSKTGNRDDSGYSGQYASADEAFSALDAVTEVPIEVVNYPSFGAHSPSASKKIESSSTDLTELVYSSIFSEQSTIDGLERKYNIESERMVADKSYLADANRGVLYRYDWLKTLLFKMRVLAQRLGGSARGLDFKSLYDASQILDFYKEIERIKEIADSGLNRADDLKWLYNFKDEYEARNFVEPYLNNIIKICNNMLNKRDNFQNLILKKQFGEPEASEEEKYIVTYFAGSYDLPELISNRARTWCAKNIDKVLSISNIKEYLDTHGPSVLGSNYNSYAKKMDDYSINSRKKDLLIYADPSPVPDDIFVQNFLSLIDNQNLQSISDDRLDRLARKYLAEGGPNYDGGKYDADWISKYRNYGSEERKKKLEVIMVSMGGKEFKQDEADEY
jgi:8-oxo-dGTP pyrophosphatase MutT (NUDIX family)